MEIILDHRFKNHLFLRWGLQSHDVDVIIDEFQSLYHRYVFNDIVKFNSNVYRSKNASTYFSTNNVDDKNNEIVHDLSFDDELFISSQNISFNENECEIYLKQSTIPKTVSFIDIF